MIRKIFKTTWHADGKGAKVMKTIGGSACPDLDPFLMLDFAKVRLPNGFPDHPHRGFETVMYVTEGSFIHEDFKGNKGTIKQGGVQWMTAGKGIVHSEMPGSATEDCCGFQLWINLTKEKKMMDPRYQEYTKEQLPVYEDQTKKVVVIAGEYNGVKAIIKPESVTHYYDVHLKGNATFEHVIPNGWNALIYPYTDLPFAVQNSKVESHSACVMLGTGQPFKVLNLSQTEEAKFIIIFGQPLNEPIARYGPFVMNTQNEINETFKDFQQARNGFEGANAWESKNQYIGQNKASRK